MFSSLICCQWPQTNNYKLKLSKHESKKHKLYFLFYNSWISFDFTHKLMCKGLYIQFGSNQTHEIIILHPDANLTYMNLLNYWQAGWTFHTTTKAPCLHSNSTRGFTRNTWHMGTQSCLFKMLQMHSSKYILSLVNNIWSVTPPQRSWVKKAGQWFLNRKVLTQRNSPHSEDSSKKPCSLIILVASNWKFCQRLTSHQFEASVVVMHRLSFEKQLSSK